MRHRKNKFRLNRSISWRRATLAALCRSLFINQSIKTTKTKAKAVRPTVERLISIGKKNDLSSRRRAFSILQDHKLVQLLFSEISPRFSKTNGGSCRILPVGFRRGDGADMVILELTEKRKVERKPVKKEEVQPKPKEKVPAPEAEPKPEVPEAKKPTKRFLGGLKKIFKKDRGRTS